MQNFGWQTRHILGNVKVANTNSRSETLVNYNPFYMLATHSWRTKNFESPASRPSFASFLSCLKRFVIFLILHFSEWYLLKSKSSFQLIFHTDQLALTSFGRRCFFLFHIQNKIVIDVNQKTSRLKQALRKCKCCVTEGEEARKVAWISDIPSSLRIPYCQWLKFRLARYVGEYFKIVTSSVISPQFQLSWLHKWLLNW